MKRKNVGLLYLAAPYSHPGPVENTHRAVKAWEKLTDAGYVVFVPHVSLLLHLVNPRPEQFWYDYGMNLLGRCDAVVRLSGYSKGADKECEWATEHNIPIYSMNDLIEKHRPIYADTVIIQDRG